VREHEGLPLPGGARIVHIGPHKTGTSALQGAFHLARRAASEQGLHYAGPNRQPLHAAQAIASVTETKPAPPGLRQWRRLVEEIEGATEMRTLASSEWFADATSPGIRRIARDLGPERLHIVVTVRPLDRVLPSQWQQNAQAGQLLAYEPWLESVFRDPGGVVGRGFWRRHRHDQLVARWAEIIGADRVTVVVADDRDRAAILRGFEALTGLRSGTLVAPDDRQNRSLTAGEVELVRELHLAMDRAGLAPPTRLSLVLFGAAQRLRQRVPGPGEARIETPGWALDAAAPIQREMVDNLRADGVRVIGDLESLAPDVPAAGRRTRRTASTRATEATDWPALAAQASLGLIDYAGLARRGFGEAGADLDAIDALSTSRLLSVLMARVGGGLSRRVPVPGRARGAAEAP